MYNVQCEKEINTRMLLLLMKIRLLLLRTIAPWFLLFVQVIIYEPNEINSLTFPVASLNYDKQKGKRERERKMKRTINPVKTNSKLEIPDDEACQRTHTIMSTVGNAEQQNSIQ